VPGPYQNGGPAQNVLEVGFPWLVAQVAGQVTGYCYAFSWHDRVIDFIHCNRCGCLRHYADVDPAPEARIAVNFRLCDEHTCHSLPGRYFDGADTFREISNDAWLS